MATATARTSQCMDPDPAVYLAFELGARRWLLGFSPGLGRKPRRRWITAGDLEAVEQEVAEAKKRFGLPASVPVRSCYEAGRDGFWLDRWLESVGIDNEVVDSSSIKVNRRARRAKSDRIDVDSLLRLRIRRELGEREVCSVVNVPSPEAEDRRQLHREMLALKRDRVRRTNRIKGLLAAQGLHLQLGGDFLARLEEAQLWNGESVPQGLRRRLRREWKRREFLAEQINELERERRRLLRESDDPALEQVRQLMGLRGIGINSAWLFVMEFFSWRDFRNGKEVGALAGLTPTPHQSGTSHREQGIGKSGNKRVRSMAIEIAWAWLRYQPDSRITRWYERRFAEAGKRARKRGLVAVARKLLVALWRYLETGEPPAGAIVST